MSKRSLLAESEDDSSCGENDGDTDNEYPQHDDDDDDDDHSSQNHRNFSEMTMEELLQLQEDIGTKAFKRKVLLGGAVESPSSHSSGVRGAPDKPKHKKFKRLNKNRPREVPMMHRAAPRLTFLDPSQKIKRKAIRDPRFDDLSGHFNLDAWKNNYKFLRETRRKEKEILIEEMKKEGDPNKRRKIESIIQRMQNQEIEQSKRDKEKEILKEEKEQQKGLLREGKKPKFMTSKERKLLLKAAQFEQLKKENKVDKYLQRKEKRKRVKELKNKRNI